MKPLVFLTAIAMALPAYADSNNVWATYTDHYHSWTDSVPYEKNQCFNVEVPIYGTVQRQGDAAGGALLGMILGGIAGKAITGKDDGAAAGAIMGGVIGADKGSKPKNEQVITGYKQEKRCDNVVHYMNVEKTAYSHSTLTFTIEGKTYYIDFYREAMQGE